MKLLVSNCCPQPIRLHCPWVSVRTPWVAGARHPAFIVQVWVPHLYHVEKYFGLQVELKVHGFNNLTHSRFTNIVRFYNGLVDNKHLCWVSCQDHLLTSLLMQLHHGHNMLTDNSQSLLYGGSRISLRALSLFVSVCLYVINSAPAH